ncbi:MAG: hypothetical protein J0H67_07925 [Rhodospirillales bacterium]|nr:hypothetical protein [Rhodospirillales bacterium]MBN8910104.1 hypothetical protein [Rhodospirillales bacterium]
MLRATALLLCLLLGACASDTMRGYVGQDIRMVTLEYGPPVNQIDLADGTRAYQWRKVSVSTTPPNAITTTDKDKKGRKVQTTQYVGGTQSVTTCLYTFFTAWNPARNAWIVTGFKEPSFDCAIGDLS